MELKMPKNKSPETASTIGYCQDIFERQEEHLPLNAKKLNSGTSSYHLNFLAQLKHFDFPETMDCPVFRRKITTLRKLPIIAPKTKIENPRKNFIA